MGKNLVKVAVLMATRNGLEYLPAQIESILNQKSCMVKLFVSDDLSTDGSLDFIEKCMESNNNVVLIPNVVSLGSAGKNFYNLIQHAEYAEFDFIAFADQDDIWEPDKLRRHIELAEKYQADGVSSNVIAFWPDGRKKLILKSHPQRAWDYLFESGGPGCSYLMTPWLVNKVREQLNDKRSLASQVLLHDWLTYAVCRAHGRVWVIDSIPSLKYRQHLSNVVGANVGLKAKWSRLQKLRQGWYRNEVIKIAQICMEIAPSNKMNRLVNLLKSKNYFVKLKLLTYVSTARRSLLDRCMLAVSILVGVF